MPVTRSNVGLSPRFSQPMRKPAPNAPSSAPPDNARRFAAAGGPDLPRAEYLALRTAPSCWKKLIVLAAPASPHTRTLGKVGISTESASLAGTTACSLKGSVAQPIIVSAQASTHVAASLFTGAPLLRNER